MTKTDVYIQNKFGYCSYGFEKDYVHIYGLFVYPEYRRSGNARELLTLAISKIRQRGYTGKIQIVANPQGNSISKDDLISFYESLDLEVFTYYG